MSLGQIHVHKSISQRVPVDITNENGAWQAAAHDGTWTWRLQVVGKGSGALVETIEATSVTSVSDSKIQALFDIDVDLDAAHYNLFLEYVEADGTVNGLDPYEAAGELRVTVPYSS